MQNTFIQVLKWWTMSVTVKGICLFMFL